VRHSQSHLSSLAALLQNAEARRIGSPSPAVVADDSGLIDIAAMQARAREERARATVATRTPVPMVRALPGAETDPDLVFSAARAQRKKKKILLGMVLGAIGLLAIAVGSSHRRAHAPMVAPQTVAAAAPPPAPSPPAPAPAPAPPPVAPAPPPAPVVAAAPPAADTAASTPGKKSKKHKHAKSKGPKLTKVQSAGVP